MEPITSSIWNVLHDGGIERIDGVVPGDIRVHVSIEYLRERFHDDGDTIVVTLSNCTVFSHRLYDADHAVSDLAAIANESLTILSTEIHGPLCRVFTDLGVLEMRCEGGAISLDSGRNVPLEELISVAAAYWNEWESRSERS